MRGAKLMNFLVFRTLAGTFLVRGRPVALAALMNRIIRNVFHHPLDMLQDHIVGLIRVDVFTGGFFSPVEAHQQTAFLFVLRRGAQAEKHFILLLFKGLVQLQQERGVGMRIIAPALFRLHVVTKGNHKVVPVFKGS